MTPISTSTRLLQIIGPAWTRTFRCLWMLEELGIPYEHLPYRPASRSVRAHNPSGKVPILLVYDANNTSGTPLLTLTESVAINTYLGDLHPSKSLVPPPRTLERAQYDQVCCTILSELDAQGLWIHRKHGEELGKYFGVVPEAVEAAQKQFTRNLLVPACPYLLGDNFTAADILYVHCLDWAQRIGWTDHAEDAKIITYLELCHARPAYQNVLALFRQPETSRL